MLIIVLRNYKGLFPGKVGMSLNRFELIAYKSFKVMNIKRIDELVRK